MNAVEPALMEQYHCHGHVGHARCSISAGSISVKRCIPRDPCSRFIRSYRPVRDCLSQVALRPLRYWRIWLLNILKPLTGEDMRPWLLACAGAALAVSLVGESAWAIPAFAQNMASSIFV